MKLYRSLVYRELRATRKHFRLMFLLFSLTAVLMMTAVFFMFSDTSEVPTPAESLALCVVMAGIPATLAGVMAGTNNGLQKADVSSGWKRYSYALPPTAAQKATSDLLAKLVYIAVFGLGVAVMTFYCAALSGSVSTIHVMNVYLAFTSVAMLCNAVYSSVIMLAKDKNQLKYVGIIGFFSTAVLFRVLGIFGMKPGASSEDSEMIPEEIIFRIVDKVGSGKTSLCVLGMFIAVCVIYYVAMRFMHGRREA